MGAYEPEWLERMAAVDWTTERGAGWDEVEIDGETWGRWHHGLVDVVAALQPKAFITIAAPPLDRPFPDLDRGNWLTRVRGKGRYIPEGTPGQTADDGFDDRLTPWIHVLVFPDGTMNASMPSAPSLKGWFPWTDDELAVIRAAGWEPLDPDIPGADDLLYWFSPKSAPADETERRWVAEDVVHRTVTVFQSALGLPDPSPLEVHCGSD